MSISAALVVGAVCALKAGAGKTIVTDGNSLLVHTLFENDLVDELYLHVYPLALGGCARLPRPKCSSMCELTRVARMRHCSAILLARMRRWGKATRCGTLTICGHEVSMPRLDAFQLSDMTRLGVAIRGVAPDARCMEDVAIQLVHLLRRELLDEKGAPVCPLVRLYRTLRYDELTDDLRAFGAGLIKGHRLHPETRCLTLLGTAGERQEWSSRETSVGHRVIPLPSAEVVASAPMVAQLLVQLGLEVSTVLSPNPAVVLEMEQRSYNVFFVENAVGSPHIPAQDQFVLPYRIRSVLGFGGLLPSGDVFAILMFTRATIPRSTADIFRNAAMNTKMALLPFSDGPIFTSEVAP